MRISMIAVGRDYGHPTVPGAPTTDGPMYLTAVTKFQIEENGYRRFLRIDGVSVGEIVAVVIDHEDEQPPPMSTLERAAAADGNLEENP